MSSYELNIEIDQKGLDAINAAGQVVTIVKQSSGGQYTAWLNFKPQQSNLVSWTSDFSVYSSTTNAQAGAVIQTSSVASAVGGSSYTLNTSGYFDPGVPGKVGPTQYQIVNADNNLEIGGVAMVTGGLLPGAQVNGGAVTSPINAVGILFNHTATFTPIETIMVFTSSYSNNGIVISQVSGSALTVEYTTNPSASITYNDQTNQFIIASQLAAAE